MTSASPQNTDFSRDILGRYTCNGLDEALQSTNQSVRPDARSFDVIVIGAGSFAGVLAQHLFTTDSAHQRRILVLEAGRLALPEHVQNLPVLGLNPPPPTAERSRRSPGRSMGSALAHQRGRRFSRLGILHRWAINLLWRLVTKAPAVRIAPVFLARCCGCRPYESGWTLRCRSGSDRDKHHKRFHLRRDA